MASAPASGTPTATPPVTFVSAHSRKVHGASGTFNLLLDHTVAMTGAVTVEPRQASTHLIVFTFSGSVISVGGATTTTGSVTTAIAGNEVRVTLSGVADAARTTVSVTGVNGSASASTAIGFLVGDLKSSRVVTAADTAAVKTNKGRTLDANNFLADIDASGAINDTDLAAVQSRAGRTLP